jgi:hypothetical protein
VQRSDNEFGKHESKILTNINKDVYFSIEVKTTMSISASVLYLYNKNTKVDIKSSVVSM